MRLIKLLAVSVVTLSCAGMPKPPTGKMYLHFHDFALCSDLETGDECQKIPMADTENYPMFHPQTWANIQNYIDALIRAVKSQNQSAPFLSSEKSDETLNALYRIKFAMRSAEKNWRNRKHGLQTDIN